MSANKKAPEVPPEGRSNLLEYRLMHRLQAAHHFT